MKRMLGCDFVVSAGLGEDGDEQTVKVLTRRQQNHEDFHTPWEPARGIGRLISGRAGTPDAVARG
jgi:hypothetical protein